MVIAKFMIEGVKIETETLKILKKIYYMTHGPSVQVLDIMNRN